MKPLLKTMIVPDDPGPIVMRSLLHEAPEPPAGDEARLVVCRGGAPSSTCRSSRAQPVSGTTVFEMASFSGPGVDPDTAFAKPWPRSRTRLLRRAGRQAGSYRLQSRQERRYRIEHPLVVEAAQRVRTQWKRRPVDQPDTGIDALISGSNHVTIRDLTIDYDPLPFTQGTIAAFDHAALQITVEIDPGCPDDPKFLATITDGFFKVMDRRTQALKAGARDFARAEPDRGGSGRN